MKSDSKPNKLVDSASPYLLQHAYNPVDWYPWGSEAFEKASAEDKPVIVSIGYSSCHWCHVMERESYENNDIAQIMNANFISIKVDREERPDLDGIYMDAVHSMGVNGGWPLNVFTTPQQKPFYGGTYFPPQQWAKLLNNISAVWKTEKDKVLTTAQALTDAISVQKMSHAEIGKRIFPDIKELVKMISAVKPNFDREKGGIAGAPKFPMPSLWDFLLKAGKVLNDSVIITQVESTLDAMATGGIYDQLGGGFSRYAVDDRWFAPHFEKMLYDNGQMISLYSDAWRVYKKEIYRKVVYDTVKFIQRELTSAEGAFYSAIDADSEGVEGKFYVWSYDQIKNAAGNDSGMFVDYYNIRERGNWENGNSILYIDKSLKEVAEKFSVSEQYLADLIDRVTQKLFEIRSERVRPGIDDKILAGWNGLVLKGLCDAYAAFGDELFLEIAENNARFIKEKMMKDGVLYRSYKNGKVYAKGCLEDYALVIQGFIALYQSDFDEAWLFESNKLCRYVIEHFSDNGHELFYFTDSGSDKLIARKKEIVDNVIPSSNSVMALNFYSLGKLLSEENYIEYAESMLTQTGEVLYANLQYMSSWASLYLLNTYPTVEIAICGPDLRQFKKELENEWITNKVIAGSTGLSSLPLLVDRLPGQGITRIYVCFDKSCRLPSESVQEAISRIPKETEFFVRVTR